MFKIRNLNENKETDTEFWLEKDDKDNGEECILLKARIVGQPQSSVIVSIEPKGLRIWEGVRKNLGFAVVDNNDFPCIKLLHNRP